MCAVRAFQCRLCIIAMQKSMHGVAVYFPTPGRTNISWKRKCRRTINVVIVSRTNSREGISILNNFVHVKACLSTWIVPTFDSRGKEREKEGKKSRSTLYSARWTHGASGQLRNVWPLTQEVLSVLLSLDRVPLPLPATLLHTPLYTCALRRPGLF